MKVKARDIVAGWPRGRSTVVLWSNWELLWFLTRTPKSEKFFALGLEVAYHEGQQEMQNAYFERWRIGEARLHDLMYGQGSYERTMRMRMLLRDGGVLGHALGFTD